MNRKIEKNSMYWTFVKLEMSPLFEINVSLLNKGIDFLKK